MSSLGRKAVSSEQTLSSAEASEGKRSGPRDARGILSGDLQIMFPQTFEAPVMKL
jgi:hypothetical protein